MRVEQYPPQKKRVGSQYRNIVKHERVVADLAKLRQNGVGVKVKVSERKLVCAEKSVTRRQTRKKKKKKRKKKYRFIVASRYIRR